jgi:hypothetical protein
MKTIAIILLLAALLPAQGASTAAASGSSANLAAADSKQPPVRSFTPREFLASKLLPYSGSFSFSPTAPKAEFELDYMQVDGTYWLVERHGSTYYTVTNQTDLDRIVDQKKAEMVATFRVFNYSGLMKWKVGERPPPVKVAGRYINVMAKRQPDGYWYVVDNRPIPSSLMGTQTIVTNQLQLLEVGMDAVRRGVEEENGKLPLGPPDGEEDPPKIPVVRPIG